MQQIERYGVIALVFLLVTIVAVSFWGDSKSPGFWSRLTGRAAKKETVASPAPEIAHPAGATGERAIQGELPLSPAANSPSLLTPLDPAPSTAAAVGAASGSPTPNSPLESRSEPSVAPASSSWVSGSPATSAVPREPVRPVRNLAAAERPAGSSEYVVEKGDSLMGIASRMLGSKSRWTEIRDLNHGIDPRSLSVGMKLALPGSGAATKSASSSKSQTPLRRPATAPASKSSGSTGGTYVVQKGDTLKSIAERRLGNSAHWKEIAASNPSLDPHHLSVGTTIRMPSAKSEPLVAAASIPVRSPDRPRVR